MNVEPPRRAAFRLPGWLCSWLRPRAAEAPPDDQALAAAFARAGVDAPLAVLRIAPDTASGSAVLQGLGGVLRQHIRRGDTAVPLPDDTFLVVLGNCGEEGALLFAGRVQERLRALQRVVTVPNVSVGIAVWHETMTSSTALLEAARGALEAARAAGGDRIRIHGRDAQLEDAAPPAAGARLGSGRGALVLTADSVAHARVLHLLRREEFDVSQDTGDAAYAEFDLVCIDLALGVDVVEARIRGMREVSPATRVVLLCAQQYGMVPVGALHVHADAVFLSGESEQRLHAMIRQLLADRDSEASALLRQRQLTAELRAREREARSAASESEARLRSVLQNIQDVVLAIDAAGQLTFLNNAWSVLTGFTLEESLGHPLAEFGHEEDRAAVQHALDTMLRSRAPYLRHEARWRTRAGTYRWAELRLQPGSDGDGATGVLVDVTDRHRAEAALRQSEQYFRSMIESSADVMTAVNADGTIRYVSPAVEPLLGYPAGDWIGRNIFERVHPEDIERAVAEFGRIVQDPEHAQDVDVRMRHRAGHWKLLEISGRNLLDASGLEVILIAARDATERRRADAEEREGEEALLRMQKMDAIARFAGEVAQDLAPVLHAVRTQLDSVRNTLEGSAPWRELGSALARADALVQRLRTIGRRLPMEPGVIDLNGLVVHARDELNARDLAGIEVVCRFAPELRPARGDPAQIARVLRELFANARAALPEGGRIEVVTRNIALALPDPRLRELAPGDYVLVSVSDTGRGVPDDVFAQIFEPFVTTRPEEHARGLGLAEAFGIVRQTGGHMAVESAPGWGTLISVFLPAA